MIRYFYWVGGGILGALTGIALGMKFGYMGGLWIGDALYHFIASRQIAYDKAS